MYLKYTEQDLIDARETARQEERARVVGILEGMKASKELQDEIDNDYVNRHLLMLNEVIDTAIQKLKE